MSNIVDKLLDEIKDNLKTRGSCKADEMRVAEAMLNDPNYVVGEYNTTGKIGEYSPYNESRKLMTSILVNASKMNKNEAINIADKYKFTNKEASIFVGLSKEFINTYLHTGRNLQLGGRKDNNTTLRLDNVPLQEKTLHFNHNIKAKNKDDAKVIIPQYEKIKAKSACPKWKKNGVVK